jgi:hypothetical protein
LDPSYNALNSAARLRGEGSDEAAFKTTLSSRFSSKFARKRRAMRLEPAMGVNPRWEVNVVRNGSSKGHGFVMTQSIPDGGL